MAEILSDNDILDDVEYSIPTVDKPTLENVLSELDFGRQDEDDNVAADETLTNNAIKIHSFLQYSIMEKISSHISCAADRVDAGLATSVAVNGFISVGTSHGNILHFDKEQNLRWAYQDRNEQGAVSYLTYNCSGIRLIAGFVRGLIIMFDTKCGDILRNLYDIVSPNSGVLSIKWTSKPNLVLCSDSGGSVWSLCFTRKLGIRGYFSKCLFTGARGEICTIEPLISNDSFDIKPYCIIALATLSKYFVVQIRPRLEVIKFYSLSGSPTCLPLLSWQMVLIQAADTTRRLHPILTAARGNNLYFRQVTINKGKIDVLLLRHVKLLYDTISLHWLGPKYCIYIDKSEVLHLIDVRSNSELESIDITKSGLVYGSPQFKGLATGGNVSPALALAGTYACYSSVLVFKSQLYVLGARNLCVISKRSWIERISCLLNNHLWNEACDLAIYKYITASEHCKGNVKKKIIDLFDKYLTKRQNYISFLAPIIKCLIEINELNFLWEVVWDRLDSTDELLILITQYIENDAINSVRPSVSQALISFWISRCPIKVEEIILNLQWTCLDLHQVLTVVRKYKLFRSQIYLNSNALKDYSISLYELIPLINSEEKLLGNYLLAYISNCLKGYGYPYGEISPDLVPVIKNEILQCLISVHSSRSIENEQPYPYLRSLLLFNAKTTLDIFSLAFEETRFESIEMGTSFKQRIINIIMEIIISEKNLWSKVGYFLNFNIRQIFSENYIPSSEILNLLMVDKIDGETSTERLEREQAWLTLLSHDFLKEISLKEQLKLAETANFYCVYEYILEKLEKYDDILKCFLCNPNYQYEVFTYIEKYVKVPERKIFVQILKYLPELLQTDSNRIVKIIVENYIYELDSLLDTEMDTNSTYLLLKNLLEYDIKLNKKFCETYLSLLSKENPSQLKEFFEKHDTYNIDNALEIIKSHSFSECCAYLYEKKGDYENAFYVLLQCLENTTTDVAETLAFEIGGLFSRASLILPSQQLEKYWFLLLKMILIQPKMTITAKILRTASQFVGSLKLIEFILSSEIKTGNLGDIKDILIDVLLTTHYDNVLMYITSRILKCDLHYKFTFKRKKTKRGLWVPFLKCIICRQRLHNQTDVILFSFCAHAAHTVCFKDFLFEITNSCPRCENNAQIFE